MSPASTTSSDWMMVDERAERFRPLFNDEYSRDALVGLCIWARTRPIGSSEYTMMQHSNKPQRIYLADPIFDPSGGQLYADLRPDLSGR